MDKIQRAGLSVLSVALVAALTACGGGGGDNGNGSSGAGSTNSSNSTTGDASSSSSSSSGAPGTDPTPTAAVSSAVGKVLKDGLYAVSYGMGSINGKSDKSIYRTRLGTKNANGKWFLYDTVHAGNDQGGNNALGDGQRAVLDPTSLYQGLKPLSAYFDDEQSTMTAGQGSPFTPLETWKLDIEESDIAGQPIQDFLTTNRSVTKPIQGLSVGGSFAAGSKGYRVKYTAVADVFLFTQREPFLYRADVFERSYGCGVSNGQTARIGYEVMPNGVLQIVELADETGCTSAMFNTATVIGTGSWSLKSTGTVSYYQIDFPAGIPVTRYESVFRDSEISPEIRKVLYTANDGSDWASGYIVPAGASFRSGNLMLNVTAADSVKQATGM
ncbi:MAG: hypothetical protein QM639_12550 [Rhodocyclaceae bacterium]